MAGQWERKSTESHFTDALQYLVDSIKNRNVWSDQEARKYKGRKYDEGSTMRSKEIVCPDHGKTMIEKDRDYFECSVKNCSFVMNMKTETEYSFSYMITRMNKQKQHDQDGVYVNGKFFDWSKVQSIIAKIKIESQTHLLTEEQKEFNSKACTYLFAAHGCNI